MPTYAIGDIQGCFDELQQLLAQIGFNPDDRLLFTGDLVNRGPKSLETLRFVRDLGERAVTVLGNHDLHLLAVASLGKEPKKKDTLHDILSAPDRDELLHWLRHQPLLHYETSLEMTLIHAGLPPQWDLATAQACAREMEAILQGDQYLEYFHHMYGNLPNLWDPALSGWDRMRFITNCFTRLRYCTTDGHLALQHKGTPGTQPEGILPWFKIDHRRSEDMRIIFGHWSTLGLLHTHNLMGLDTGCLWGGSLTAIRLEDHQVFQLECGGHCRPDTTGNN
jgi:bis(5'-nucleosyl)-tetraphosphatase (symmetrical)